MADNIQLNNHINIKNTSHIFYLYDDIQKYKYNLISYIKTGVSLKHQLIIIENPVIYKEIIHLLTKEEQKLVHYIDNFTFYQYYEGFQIDRIANHFTSLIEPLVSQNVNIRTWAQVIWKKEFLIDSLVSFEEKADCCVNELGIMSVCAYSSSQLNAKIQTAFMKKQNIL
ncbi:MEDS domain-containing protein [Niallia sp. JL1B1071]|uniref:MEDS domain-containing protein n=1 Tax=Niallia tiangongensis TaxID=3237105 RepID=UPI0037DC1476